MALRISIIFFIMFFTFGYSQNLSDLGIYIAHKTLQEIKIDGRDNDKDWGRVNWSNDYIDIEGIKKPKYKTQMKILWDEKYFYILARMEEPHIWGNITERDAVIFHNNDFEVFVDPDGDTHNYFEIETNVLNTAWDLFLTKPYREGGNAAINDWDIIGLKSAIHINGTLNDPTDTDKEWILEMAIPWSTFKISYYQDIVPRDQFWRLNFSRVNWQFDIENGKYRRKKDANGKYLHEYNWVWSPTGVVNIHEPEKWGYVFFSTKEAGTKDSFTISNDERIKWEMYKLHRAHKAYYKEHNSFVTVIDDLTNTPIIVDNKEITPILENHSTGYNIVVKSPFTDKILILKEDGKFIYK
jgi:hypothetical protein